MATKETIEKLRKRLNDSVEAAKELTQKEILELSKKLDKEIYEFHLEEDQNKDNK